MKTVRNKSKLKSKKETKISKGKREREREDEKAIYGYMCKYCVFHIVHFVHLFFLIWQSHYVKWNIYVHGSGDSNRKKNTTKMWWSCLCSYNSLIHTLSSFRSLFFPISFSYCIHFIYILHDIRHCEKYSKQTNRQNDDIVIKTINMSYE